MKFQETHFEEYTNAVLKINLHQKLDKILARFPVHLNSLGNLIFYGPSGVGKYSQMLHFIKRYSPTELKYEKKISVTYDKKQYFFKISDIHYEIDMSLLGCNSKLLWHEIYQQIVDILSAKNEKNGIIVCKEFHNIHSELLENFYSYMQDNNDSLINIKYILLTEEISFIPDRSE
jgi:Holliday junction resolvasome RuvABC ATP-dependent DNA helicase subunit